MTAARILVVDDEKNIRLTVPQVLEPLGAVVETAVNGEEALAKLDAARFDLILLDLKMPGMNGMDVLRALARGEHRPRVIIVTAHGTVESAVEAMKLGAVDYIQKPFSPTELRGLIERVLAREDLDEQADAAYEELIELAKKRISDRAFDRAEESVRSAIGADPGQPEAYNLLGALREILGKEIEALKYYRAALEIDPTYRPASQNLYRVSLRHRGGHIDLGAEAEPEGGRSDRGRGDRDER